MVVNETRKRLLRQLNSRWIKGRIVRVAITPRLVRCAFTTGACSSTLAA